MLDVILPGTGGMIPLVDRWLSCCWIEYKGSAILIDCGEGTQVALKKCGVKHTHLDMLLLTHYHADHVAGLPGLLLALGNNGKTSPLTIVGPPGLGQIVTALTLIAPVLLYDIKLVELRENTFGDIKSDELTISYRSLRHGIPCFGYRITVDRKPVFDPQKAELLGVPIKLYKRLHSGEQVRLTDGRVIEPEMVINGRRDPLRVTYCTDTVLMDEMIEFARDSDLLICEGMYFDEQMREKMESRGHMIFQDSARLASLSGSKKLWITHFSPAIKNPDKLPDDILEIFSEALAAYDGIRITLGSSADNLGS